MLDTIKSSAQISLIFTQGRRIHTPYLTLIVLRREKQHDPCGRVAFLAGKKFGNAVWRNRAKRRMREICRALNGPWYGLDVIFLAKSNIMDISYSKVLAVCVKAVKKGELA